MMWVGRGGLFKRSGGVKQWEIVWVRQKECASYYRIFTMVEGCGGRQRGEVPQRVGLVAGG